MKIFIQWNAVSFVSCCDAVNLTTIYIDIDIELCKFKVLYYAHAPEVVNERWRLRTTSAV